MSQVPFPDSEPPRNPDTYAVHRRESIWQIWVPLAITLTVLALLVILIFVSQHGSLSQWASVALIMLLIPLLILGIIVLAVNVGGFLFTGIAYSKLSPLMLQAQLFFLRVEKGAFQAANSVTEPVIRVRVFWARLTGVRGKKKPSPEPPQEPVGDNPS